ncbi:hypothetical protein SAMD00079811_76550 (plasmid) [Scytonema sp. HK-05]|nr:hypothetical protein SAMD00079811_76550 [Scytonema sp. HK-05]
MLIPFLCEAAIYLPPALSSAQGIGGTTGGVLRGRIFIQHWYYDYFAKMSPFIKKLHLW